MYVLKKEKTKENRKKRQKEKVNAKRQKEKVNAMDAVIVRRTSMHPKNTF